MFDDLLDQEQMYMSISQTVLTATIRCLLSKGLGESVDERGWVSHQLASPGLLWRAYVELCSSGWRFIFANQKCALCCTCEDCFSVVR
jgi:hypothetical protein